MVNTLTSLVDAGNAELQKAKAAISQLRNTDDVGMVAVVEMLMDAKSKLRTVASVLTVLADD
jgi:hypothetical protein